MITAHSAVYLKAIPCAPGACTVKQLADKFKVNERNMRRHVQAFKEAGMVVAVSRNMIQSTGAAIQTPEPKVKPFKTVLAPLAAWPYPKVKA